MSDFARYDYAWKTPGWTVQNPVVNYATDGSVNPGMPSDVTLVTLFGEFMELDTGRGLEGVLRIRVNEDLTHVPSGRLVPAGELDPVRFRGDGFAIQLPATDDPQLTPTFEYQGRLTVRGDRHDFTFTLPAAVPSVNIRTLL